MANEYIIGLDVGTQSTRVIIFDRDGAMVSKGARKHQPHMINKPGWAEHPMGDLWNAFWAPAMTPWSSSRAHFLKSRRSVCQHSDAAGPM